MKMFYLFFAGIMWLLSLSWLANPQAVLAQTAGDSGISVGTTNQLAITIGSATALTPTPTGVSQAPGPVIPVGTTDTLTIIIGSIALSPTPGGPSPTPGGPTSPPGSSPTPGPTSSPGSCEKKAKKIIAKSKKVLDKIRFQIGRIDNIWERTLKRVNKSDKTKKHYASRIKSIGRRHDAVVAALKSAENTVDDMKKCGDAKKAGKTFIKKIRKLQSRLESYKTAVQDIVHDVKEGEKKNNDH